MEKWKVIADYPNYEVSNRGQVRSVTHLIKCRGGGSRLMVGRILKLYKRKDGYFCVGLYGNGCVASSSKVHRLVLDAFRGPKPRPIMVCRHLDGDPANNRLANLVWGTCKENMDDQRRHGTRICAAGETNPGVKLTDKKVLRIRKLYATGEYTLAAIAAAYGVSTASVHNVIRRKNWKHLS